MPVRVLKMITLTRWQLCTRMCPGLAASLGTFATFGQPTHMVSGHTRRVQMCVAYVMRLTACTTASQDSLLVAGLVEAQTRWGHRAWRSTVATPVRTRLWLQTCHARACATSAVMLILVHTPCVIL